MLPAGSEFQVVDLGYEKDTKGQEFEKSAIREHQMVSSLNWKRGRVRFKALD